MARIRDTTQIFLDVYRGEGLYYIHPLKVWDRYSAKMFLPHAWDPGDGTLRTVEDGVALSRYYRVLEEEEAQEQDQSLDSHDRFFSAARMAFRQGSFSRETERQIVESTMTKDRRLQEMLRRYFEPRDYFLLRDRMAGSGSIGGKACGMLLARKIVRKELPGYESCLEPHDSFYIGSDVFYTYIYVQQLLGAAHSPADKGGLFQPGGGTQTGSADRGIPREYTGEVPVHTGLFRAEPCHRAVLQLSGGRLRERLCREI